MRNSTTNKREALVEGRLPFPPAAAFSQPLVARTIDLGGGSDTRIWEPSRRDAEHIGLDAALTQDDKPTPGTKMTCLVLSRFLRPTRAANLPLAPALIPNPKEMLESSRFGPVWRDLGLRTNRRGQLWPAVEDLDELRPRVVEIWGNSEDAPFVREDTIARELTRDANLHLGLGAEDRFALADEHRQQIDAVILRVGDWLSRGSRVNTVRQATHDSKARRAFRTDLRREVQKIAKQVAGKREAKTLVARIRVVAATEVSAMTKLYCRGLMARMAECQFFATKGDVRLFRLLFGRYRLFDNGLCLGPLDHDPVLSPLFWRFLSNERRTSWLRHVYEDDFDPAPEVLAEWVAWLRFYVEAVRAQREHNRRGYDAENERSKRRQRRRRSGKPVDISSKLPAYDLLLALADPDAHRSGKFGAFAKKVKPVESVNAVLETALTEKERTYLLAFVQSGGTSWVAGAEQVGGIDRSWFQKVCKRADSKIAAYIKESRLKLDDDELERLSDS